MVVVSLSYRFKVLEVAPVASQGSAVIQQQHRVTDSYFVADFGPERGRRRGWLPSLVEGRAELG